MTNSRALAGRVGFALVLAWIAASAAAQDTDRAKHMAAEMQKRFAAADKNGDGRLTRDEAQIAAFAREQRAARKATSPSSGAAAPPR